ncbi:ABC transporter ATP-binding protein [Candidatus Nomurabacteria bacterium]|uniref:ABC transporter ATP-binding protein n=1 Tax=candidate division WWE3 bacterium TaxID=2053526 RepID=A0A955E1B0_UNCKA|nr:ABC transporter ATP-binding protein [candidate division WWE3 bacterium]MCB9824030.1 ABC transporter ATP-binding protein [Candidatus Nomurabacteria bacterium]MCB9826999.1 ABC transporter ATP-binding protein [Candidatus Nomurabacteria bacterium]MCB9827971.1 ABC transporter ATP-binding protein [Candidatus Nomurabacteria bacterium]
MRKKVLVAKDLVKLYKVGTSEIRAVNGVSLEIDEGEFIAIVGKSGSGKSTLMHMIGLLDTPTSGQIILNGSDVSFLKDNELAKIRNREIGFVFQSFNLLPRTSSIDNVMLPLKYSNIDKSTWRQKAEDMLRLVELSDRKDNKSNELSGGQKQRVAIARALVTDPSIILADEPTGNLDSKTGVEIVELFKKLNKQGKTIIIVTHDDDLAKIAQRQIVIRDGKII